MKGISMKGDGQAFAALAASSRAVGKRKTLAAICAALGEFHMYTAEAKGQNET
jgi:hypothetical protein